MARQIPKAGQRQQRSEIFKITTSGLSTGYVNTSTILTEGTYHATCALTGTGVIGLQLNADKVYARLPAVQAQAVSAAGKLFCVTAGNTSGGLITINVFSDAGTATTPTGIDIQLVGSDVVDQI